MSARIKVKTDSVAFWEWIAPLVALLVCVFCVSFAIVAIVAASNL